MAEPPATGQAGVKTLDHLSLSVDRKVLNPAREPGATAILTVTGTYSDGSRRVLGPSEVVIKARTKSASGNVEVVAIEGNRVVPKEGGVAALEVSAVVGGNPYTAATDVVVAPYYRDYHQTLVLKLFLGMEGEPVERLANDPTFRKGHEVMCTFEEALDVKRLFDR